MATRCSGRVQPTAQETKVNAMPRATAELSTRAFLHTHGIQISPGKLELLVEEAIGRLRRDLFRADPKKDLTEEEAKVLERGIQR